MIETETEMLVEMPTAVFRHKVNALTDQLYNLLLEHFYMVVIVVSIIILIIFILIVRNSIVKHRAKKMMPISTNNWFSWGDFEKWQEKQKK